MEWLDLDAVVLVPASEVVEASLALELVRCRGGSGVVFTPKPSGSRSNCTNGVHQMDCKLRVCM